MSSKILKFITDCPYAKKEVDRLKYQIFRAITFGFALSTLIAFIWYFFAREASAHNAEANVFRIVWPASTIANFFIWFMACSKHYRYSVLLFAFVMCALTNIFYALLPLDSVLYRQLIYSFLTLLIVSVYVPKRQLYAAAILFYVTLMVNIFIQGNFNLSPVLPVTVACTFAIAGVGLVTKLRIEEAKILERERARAIHSSRLSTLGETTAFLVHEVSSPLTILNGHMELLRKNENPSYHIEKMQNALDRAFDFMSSVKKMVRSTMPTEYEIVQLSEILKMVSDLVEPGLKRKGISLEFDYAEDLELKCRPAEIAQVLINMINNSSDALENSSNRWIRVSTRQSEGFVDFEVSDPGSGIDPEVARKMLDPFFTTKETGSGIGLAIAQQVADAHNGSIEVVRYKDPTTIRLRIALAPKFVKARAGSFSTPQASRSRKYPDLHY